MAQIWKYAWIYTDMYICIYIYIYIYIHIMQGLLLIGAWKHHMKSYAYIHVYTRVYKYIYIHVYTYIYPCIRVHNFVLQIWTHICLHLHGVLSSVVAIIIWRFIRVYTCTYVGLFTYAYIRTHSYICNYS